MGDAVAAGPERRRIRPVLLTALLGIVFVIAQAWWIAGQRRLGAFNVDEEGGLAAALRFHRALGWDPVPLYREIFSTWNGPMVPLLAAPIIALGPHSIATVMLIQPILVVLAACGVAGAVATTGHRTAALLAGVVTMLLPVSVVSSRSFQYSTGVGAFLALGMWALLASDRGRRLGPMIALGAACAAMILSRTMSAAFLPAIGVAGLVVVDRRDRRVLRNVAASVATLVVLAGPWWFAQWSDIIGYLTENAYGGRARYWGSVAIADRIGDHVGYTVSDFRLLLIVAIGGGAILAGTVAVRRARRVEGPVLDARRALVAIWIVAALGRLALMSTSNLGYWFAYPLDVVMVAGGVGLLAAVRPAPGRAGPLRWQRAAGIVTLAFALVSFGLSLPLAPNGRLADDDWRWAFVADHGALYGGGLEAEPALDSPDRNVRHRAADAWWAAATRLAGEIERIARRDGPVLQTVVGEIHLMNANTILLAEEDSRTGIYPLEVINTLEPTDAEILRSISPRTAAERRVLVVVTGRSLGFPNGRGRERLIRLARDTGWRPGRPIPLPDGGDVTVWTHR